MYLSSKRLNILPWERRGLIDFIASAPFMRHLDRNDVPPREGTDFIFNLGTPCTHYGWRESTCGTIGCIGGFVGYHHFGTVQLARDYVFKVRETLSIPIGHSDQPVDENGHSSALDRLYWPGTYALSRFEYDDWTPQAVAEAVKHFLRTGQTIYRNPASDHSAPTTKETLNAQTV